MTAAVIRRLEDFFDEEIIVEIEMVDEFLNNRCGSDSLMRSMLSLAQTKAVGRKAHARVRYIHMEGKPSPHFEIPEKEGKVTTNLNEAESSRISEVFIGKPHADWYRYDALPVPGEVWEVVYVSEIPKDNIIKVLPVKRCHFVE